MKREKRTKRTREEKKIYISNTTNTIHANKTRPHINVLCSRAFTQHYTHYVYRWKANKKHKKAHTRICALHKHIKRLKWTHTASTITRRRQRWQQQHEARKSESSLLIHTVAKKKHKIEYLSPKPISFFPTHFLYAIQYDKQTDGREWERTRLMD